MMLQRLYVILMFVCFVPANGLWAQLPGSTSELTGSKESSQVTSIPKLPALPEELTSFGAARVGDKLFVYGGHTGSAHSYSTEEQSDRLLCLDLQQADANWQEESTDQRLQGLGMVSHDGDVIYLGGFTARNKPDEEQDLHSQAKVRRYSVAKQKWYDLPDLPRGRSSHDAAIVDGTIYVVGGWEMSGEEETQWHDTAWSLDLATPEARWEELPKPPFVTRALATVAHADKLFVIGGMDKEGGPTVKVHVFDPQTQEWSAGPDLIGEGQMVGFGAAGCSVNGRLYVSTYNGDLLRLSEAGDAWELIGKTQDARFFHRLLPLTPHSLAAVGGANMEAGKFYDVEVIPLDN